MERKTVNLLDGGRYEGEVNDAGLPHGRPLSHPASLRGTGPP